MQPDKWYKASEFESVVEKAQKEKNELNVKEEFNKVASEYVKKGEIGDQLHRENWIMSYKNGYCLFQCGIYVV